MNDKEAMRNKVRMYAFALVDANLYLDAYPESDKAIEYFQNTKSLYDTALAEYEGKYGPLSSFNGVQNGAWVWTDGPWPWQCGNEVNL